MSNKILDMDLPMWIKSSSHQQKVDFNGLVMNLIALYKIQSLNINYCHGTLHWFGFAASTNSALQGTIS